MQQVQKRVAQREKRRRGSTSCQYESGHMVNNHVTVIQLDGVLLKQTFCLNLRAGIHVSLVFLQRNRRFHTRNDEGGSIRWLFSKEQG